MITNNPPASFSTKHLLQVPLPYKVLSQFQLNPFLSCRLVQPFEYIQKAEDHEIRYHRVCVWSRIQQFWQACSHPWRRFRWQRGPVYEIWKKYSFVWGIKMNFNMISKVLNIPGSGLSERLRCQKTFNIKELALMAKNIQHQFHFYLSDYWTASKWILIIIKK